MNIRYILKIFREIIRLLGLMTQQPFNFRSAGNEDLFIRPYRCNYTEEFTGTMLYLPQRWFSRHQKMQDSESLILIIVLLAIKRFYHETICRNSFTTLHLQQFCTDEGIYSGFRCLAPFYRRGRKQIHCPRPGKRGPEPDGHPDKL